jgi:hypothetical protein
MTETKDRVLQFLPWFIALALVVALGFQMREADRYKLSFGTYQGVDPSGNAYVPFQGAARIDSRTGKVWVLSPQTPAAS